MLDWQRSYSSAWRVYRVNVETWADGDRVDGIDSITVTRDATGTAPLMESGTVTVTNAEIPRGWYRIAMVAEQDGTRERVDVATLELVRSGGTTDHGVPTDSVTARSVLYPASTLELSPSQYAPAGSDGAEYAARLLRLNCAAPVEVVGGGFPLAGNVVPKDGESALSVAWRVCDAGGHVIRITGNGTIRVMPRPTKPALELDGAGASLLLPSVDYGDAYDGVPNRLTVTEGTNRVTVTNEDAASPTSYQQVGYWIDASERNPTRVGGETLDAYARRRLAELSTVRMERTYKRKWWPEVYPLDVVRASLASGRLDGDLRIERQSLECGAGITVTERAALEVRTWQ